MVAELGPAAALPRGSVRARSQAAWLAAVTGHPDAALLRADADANLRAIAATLARYADWANLTSRPTWARLASLAGVSHRTVARWTAWLRNRGLLGVVETGSTPATRPMALADLEGNRAALYLLCHPSPTYQPGHPRTTADDERVGTARSGVAPVDKNGMPSGPAPQEMRQNGRAPASYDESPLRGVAMRTPPAIPQTAPAPPDHLAKEAGATKEANSAQKREWGRYTPTRTRSDMLALCARLQAEAAVYRAVGSTRRLRHLLRPWLQAGWTIAGLTWAIDTKPDGTPWRYAWRSVSELRNPAGWLRHRLRRWTTPDGTPLPDPRRTEGDAPTSALPSNPRRGVATEDRSPTTSAAFAALRQALRGTTFARTQRCAREAPPTHGSYRGGAPRHPARTGPADSPPPPLDVQTPAAPPPENRHQQSPAIPDSVGARATN